jgi:hypothetical protein
MIELLYAVADGTFPNGHEKTIGLGEFRIMQAIERIFKENLRRAVSGTRLSYDFSEYSETQPMHKSRSLRSSDPSFSHKPEGDAPSPPEA